MAKKKPARKKPAKKVSPLKGRTHRKWGTVKKHSRKVAGSNLGKVSMPALKSEMKTRLKETLGKDLVRRELATTKRDKKKISKKIRLVKTELRKLN